VGAIQDTQRGLIVGDARTFGKGTVQNLNDLDNNLGAIKVTFSKFFRPSGASTQLKGVPSDIVLPSLFNSFEVGEEYYDYALPFEQIDAKPFPNFNLVSPFVNTLKEASNKRVEASKDFAEVKKHITEYEEGKAERLRVSLKEDPKNKAKNDLLAAEEEELALKEPGKKDKFKKLTNDIYLQEALYIASDYARSIKKQAPLPMKIVGLPAKVEKKKAVSLNHK
jgi:carboxyl-terminal processing protease